MLGHKNIVQLKEDHIKVNASLDALEKALDFIDLEMILKELKIHLEFFRDFTCKVHHKRESEVLFKWLLEENPSFDRQVIDRITAEHDELEIQVEKFLTRVYNFSLDDKSSLLCEIEDFIRGYKQHVEREEKCVFLVAEEMA